MNFIWPKVVTLSCCVFAIAIFSRAATSAAPPTSMLLKIIGFSSTISSSADTEPLWLFTTFNAPLITDVVVTTENLSSVLNFPKVSGGTGAAVYTGFHRFANGQTLWAACADGKVVHCSLEFFPHEQNFRIIKTEKVACSQFNVNLTTSAAALAECGIVHVSSLASIEERQVLVAHNRNEGGSRKVCGTKASGPRAVFKSLVSRFATAFDLGLVRQVDRELDLRIVCDDAFIFIHNNNLERALQRLNIAMALLAHIMQCQLHLKINVRSTTVARNGVFARTTHHIAPREQLDSAALTLKRYMDALDSAFLISRAPAEGGGGVVVGTDAIHFVSGRAFANNIRGLADVEGACDPQRGASISSDNDINNSAADLAIVIMHELGHIIGMHHRDERCECIMSPQLLDNAGRGFDTLSRAESEVFMRFGGQCIAALPPNTTNSADVGDRCSSERQAKALSVERNRVGASGVLFPTTNANRPPTATFIRNTDSTRNNNCISIFNLRSCKTQAECNARCPGWRCVPPFSFSSANINQQALQFDNKIGSCQPPRLQAPCMLKRDILGQSFSATAITAPRSLLNVINSDIVPEETDGDECGLPLVCCERIIIQNSKVSNSMSIPTSGGGRGATRLTGFCMFVDSPTCKRPRTP